jgi:hypothetical protein
MDNTRQFPGAALGLQASSYQCFIHRGRQFPREAGLAASSEGNSNEAPGNHPARRTKDAAADASLAAHSVRNVYYVKLLS